MALFETVSRVALVLWPGALSCWGSVAGGPPSQGTLCIVLNFCYQLVPRQGRLGTVTKISLGRPSYLCLEVPGKSWGFSQSVPREKEKMSLKSFILSLMGGIHRDISNNGYL